MRFPSDLNLDEPRLHAVNVGRPATHEWSGGVVTTAIWKTPAEGRRRVRRLNIDGDEQADKQGHGGEHRAVMVYQLDSYDFWQRHFDRDDFEWGQFGENFTVTGLSDASVCIGDRYRIGTALFEVTQPRVTCYRVGIRLGVPDMAARLVQYRRPGFYLRVIEEGDVGAGDEIVRKYRPSSTLTVTGIDALLYLPDKSMADLRTSVGITALSQGWRSSLQDLLDEADAAADPRAAFAWPGFATLRITDVIAETDTIRSIVLGPPEGIAGLPPVRAGQYLTIRVRGDDGTSTIRNYSLSSPPAADHYRISVKREELGKVSAWLHANLSSGMTLDAAVPRGEFTLRGDDNPILLASAGIGVTPVLAMLADLADRRPAQHVVWLQIVRGPQDRPFTTEVRSLMEKLPDGRAHIFYTGSDARAAVDEQTPPPSYEHSHYGRPDSHTLGALGIDPRSAAYLCGPAAFMTSMTDLLVGLGLDNARIHSETFGASGPANASTVAAHPPVGEAGDGPAVTFSRTGLTVAFDDRFSNLLELAEACDVAVHWSCRTGVCHSCETALVAGEIDYAPDPLDPPGGGRILLCCGRARSDLVLDA